MGRQIFITGEGNSISSDVTGLTALNCTEQEFTTEHNDKTIANNGKLVVTNEGATMDVSYETKTSSFIVQAGNKGIYFLDCTAGDIDVVLQSTASYPVWFIREDNSANDILLIAGTGNINGAGSVPMPAQYQKNSVVFNGTNFRT